MEELAVLGAEESAVQASAVQCVEEEGAVQDVAGTAVWDVEEVAVQGAVGDVVVIFCDVDPELLRSY